MIFHKDENNPLWHIKWELIPPLIKRRFFNLLHEEIDVNSEANLDVKGLVQPFSQMSSYDNVHYTLVDPNEDVVAFLDLGLRYMDGYDWKTLEISKETILNEPSKSFLEAYSRGFEGAEKDFAKEIKAYNPRSTLNDQAVVSFIFRNTIGLAKVELGGFYSRIVDWHTEEGEVFKSVSRFDLKGSGYCGGRLFSAWKAILDNPLQFEKVFNDNRVVHEIDLAYMNQESGKQSAMQKLRYFDAIGGIDFIQSKFPFGISANKIAQIIAPILDEKPSTIQTYVSATMKRSKSTNNASNSLEEVDAVRKFYKSIGVEGEVLKDGYRAS
jgi:hypothetical protein